MMEASIFASLSIPKTHLTVGLSNLLSQDKQYATLFKHRRLPDEGWSDFQIQSLVMTLSSLDTNRDVALASSIDQEYDSESDDSDTNGDEVDSGGENFFDKNRGKKKKSVARKVPLLQPPRWCGVGEREGRIYSTLVSSRHYNLSHGIGRSGDITEPQPKAVGSSILAQLTLSLVLDAMRRGSGLDSGNKKSSGPAKHGIVLPLCTGMSMSIVLSSLRESSIKGNKEMKERDVVLWSRIDQKSCFKAILSAGLKCVVVPTKLDGDQVVTDIDAIEEKLKFFGNRVLAIISTTSCFAPRVADQVDEIAKLCQSHEGVAHVINNAYGLQCKQTCKLINRACVVGRVDAVVCSMDKNFLVPVGGAIVTSPDKNTIQNIGKVYAGRASSAPILDLFITLLSMGLNGYKRLLEKRMRLVGKFERKLERVAKKHGERKLLCPKNTISFGITLDTLGSTVENLRDNAEEGDDEIDNDYDYAKKVAEVTSYFGSMLFTRCVSGTRVIPKDERKIIAKHEFVGFGSSTDSFPHSYLTAACAIGLSSVELDEFFDRLDKCFKDFSAQRAKDKAKSRG